MQEKIKAICPECRRTDMFDRVENDPQNAVLLTLICPDCDDGDFHSPNYFNVNGKEIDWETGNPYS